MLFGKSKRSYDLALLKHVAEILVSFDLETYHKLRKASAETISSTLESEGIKCNSSIQSIREYLKYLGKSETYINKFNVDLTLYLMEFQDFTLPAEYSRVGYVSDKMKKRVENRISRSMKGKFVSFSDSDWAYIADRIYEDISKYSSNNTYDPKSNGVIGFIMQSVDFYLQRSWQEVTNLVNSRGINKNFEGADYSLADIMLEDAVYVEDLPDFDKLAAAIYQMSALLYSHSNTVFYDVFSRYKYSRAERHFEDIRNILQKSFSYSSMYHSPILRDINFRIGGPSETIAREKKRWRESIVLVLDRIVDDSVEPEDLETLVEQIIAENYLIYDKRDIKNSLPILAIPKTENREGYKPRDKIDNDTKIKILLLGMSALRDVIKYCRRTNVNMFKVYSDVFRDERMVRRFKTFREYIERYEITKSLIDEASSRKDYIPLRSNDDVIKDVFESARSSIKDFSFYSIKEALSSYRDSLLTTKDDSKVKPLLDSDKLAMVDKTFRNFFEKRQELPPYSEGYKYYLMYRGVYPKLEESIWKGIKELPNGTYCVDPSFDLERLASGLFSEEQVEFLVKGFMFFEGNKANRDLSFLRAREFIGKFLYLVKNFKDMLRSSTLTSELKFYIMISSNIDAFMLPYMPKNQDEFSWFLDKYDVNPFLLEGEDLGDVSKNMVWLYNRMREEFSPLFDYMNELYEKFYVPMNDGLKLVRKYKYDISTELLAEAGLKVYVQSNPNAVLPEAFQRFKQFCVVDSYGFLFRNGVLYKNNPYGSWAYLHEKGFWVMFTKEGPRFISVTESDVFT